MRPAARVRRAWVVLAAAVEQGRSRALWCPCRSWFCSPVRRSARAAPSLRPRAGGVRAHHERARERTPSATRRARCAASPRGVLFPLSQFAVCAPGVFLGFGLALLPCYASSAHHRPHRRSLRRSRRCSRSARAARPPPLAPSFAPPFYPVRASTRAIARATTTHAAAPTPPACVMTTRARISSRSPSRTKRTSRGNERAIWGVRGAVRTWRFVVTVARRRRRRSACLIFLEKHTKK